MEILRAGKPIDRAFVDLRGASCTLRDEPTIACSVRLPEDEK
jgi:hypothetical protein